MVGLPYHAGSCDFGPGERTAAEDGPAKILVYRVEKPAVLTLDVYLIELIGVFRRQT
jgi:hypothetical protein